MLRISWESLVTNENVLGRAGAKREMMRKIRQKQLRFLGHIMRDQKLESVCVAGRIEGRRGRGRTRIKFMENLARSLDGSITPRELLQMTGSREEWRRMVDKVPWDTSPR